MKIIKDFVGQKFGKITVLEELPFYTTTSGNNRRMFKVQCSCGNIYDISLPGLKKSRKCKNCVLLEQKLNKDKLYDSYIGQRFGKLVITSKSKHIRKYKEKQLFICTCDCGNTIETDYYSIISRTSCGCDNYLSFYNWCKNNKREELLDLWDYENNPNIDLKIIPSTTKKKYHWKCKLGHKWEAATNQICRLDKNYMCPVCSGRQVCSGFNDLETLYPDIAREWHPMLNKAKKPTQYRPGSSVKIWWKCDKNHEWQTSIAHRVKDQNCPYCSGTKLLKGFNDFKTWCIQNNRTYIIDEWSSKNGKNIDDYMPHVKDKVWWKCKEGHEWQTAIENRANGNNCPICSKRSTSIPEQTILFYLSKYFNCLSRDKTFGVEFDIYIPDKRIAIEYDGSAWHGTTERYLNDVKKNNICIDNNIHLYRIREFGCHYMDEDDYIKIYNYEYKNESSFSNCLNNLLHDLGITETVDLKRDYTSILEQYYKSDDDKSLAKMRPDLAEEWHPTKNGKLTPEKISYGSQINIWWIGKCGHEFQKSPNARRRISTCPFCATTRLNTGINDFKTVYHELCEEWDYNKNTITPDKVSKKNNTKIWWIDKYGHSWQASIAARVNGSGCPYCSGRYAIKGVNDIETTNPDILIDWDYDKNNILPETVKPGSDIVVWWKCHKCGFNYKKKIIEQVKQTYSCPNCNPSKIKKIINLDTGEIFDNLVEASDTYNIARSNLCKCCKGQIKSCGGYHWAYYEE